MKKRYMLMIALIAFVLIMVVTNPKQEDYVNWATNELTADKGILLSLGANQLAKPVIDSATETTNFMLFSVYKTAVPHNDSIVTTVGLLNQFIQTEAAE
ncbi:DUF4359 domain-containing protein [Cytobacillus sp. FJAT-54145]|uniref:DUF4359 domain-containing protein n=1 Tax=Cytobacillus spartinae TaxID=3299023 RepID=A0ABW6K801_9BACI